MKPPAFDYLRAETLEQALEALAEHGDEAKVIAGGQSLLAMLNMRLLAPEVLVDIANLDELATLGCDDANLHIGAGITQGQLARLPALQEASPLVAAALEHVGHYQTRARGTVCGSLVHADPSSELPLCLALLEGDVTLLSRAGTRTLDAPAFQTGMLETACAPEEIVASVRLPARDEGEGQAFAEYARRHGDFAVVAAGARVRGSSVRLGFGGIDDRPAVRTFDDLAPGDEADAVDTLLGEVDIMEDRHAPAAYRRRLARALGVQVIREARS